MDTYVNILHIIIQSIQNIQVLYNNEFYIRIEDYLYI